MNELSAAAQAAMYSQWAHMLFTILYGIAAFVMVMASIASIQVWRDGDGLRYYDDLKDDFIGLGFIVGSCSLALALVIATPRHMHGTPSWWPVPSSIPLVGAHAGTIERYRALVALDAKQKTEADALVAEQQKMKTALAAYASSGVVDDALMGTIPNPLVSLSSATIRRAEYVASYHVQGTSEGHGFMPPLGGIAPISLVNTGTITPLMTEEGAVLLVQSGERATRIYLPGRASVRAIIDECRASIQTLAQRNPGSLYRSFYPPTHIAKVVPDLANDIISVAQTISLDGLSEVDRIVAEAAIGERMIHVQGYYRSGSEEGMMFIERLSFTDAPETVYRFPAAVALEAARFTRQWANIALSSQMPDIPDDPKALRAFRSFNKLN